MSDKIIMYDSAEAAQLKTVTGWVSRDGYFYGDKEDLARYAGCTHKVCGCGKPVSKSWLICEDCREAKRKAKYLAMPEQASADGFLYSDTSQEYFFGWDQAEEYAEDNGLTLHDLDLIVCEPTFMSEVDEERWSDELPEDCCLDDVAPAEVLKKLRELNELIRSTRPVLSYQPGKYRVSLADVSSYASQEPSHD